MADIPPSDVTTLFPAEAGKSAPQNNSVQNRGQQNKNRQNKNQQNENRQNNDPQNKDMQGLHYQLAELESEHRDLDEVISRLSDGTPVNQLQIQRMKKRKLNLKDEITRLHAKLLPDIIA